MLGRLAIRNIELGLLDALSAIAAKHERSTEAEARFAIRHWIEKNAAPHNRERRRGEVAKRLNWLIGEINTVRQGRHPLQPSHVAKLIGESHAEPAEAWFAGQLEPSFAQLEAISSLFGNSADWLQHGDGVPFVVTETRIPSDNEEAIRWLLIPEPPRDRMTRIDKISFVRADAPEGYLAIIQHFEDSRCRVFTTPYQISEHAGPGGRSQLAEISNFFCLLYKIFTRGNNCPHIESTVLSADRYDQLVRGKTHPLIALGDRGHGLWWEDWWDPAMFQDKARKDLYWPGWQIIAASTYDLVDKSDWGRTARQAILDGSHPAFKIILPYRGM